MSGPRVAAGMLVLMMVGCSAGSQAAPPSQSATPDSSSGSPSAAALPVSKYAAECVRDNKAQNQAFLYAVNRLPDPSNATFEEAQAFSATIERVSYWLALNAGGMDSELAKRGPVQGGDECLYGSALGLELIAQALPMGSESYTTTIERMLRHYRSLLQYYPDTQWADEAQQSIDEWS
jgi:hypothetical protein